MISLLALVELGCDAAASKNVAGTASRFDENLTTWASADDAPATATTAIAAAYAAHLPERMNESPRAAGMATRRVRSLFLRAHVDQPRRPGGVFPGLDSLRRLAEGDIAGDDYFADAGAVGPEPDVDQIELGD